MNSPSVVFKLPNCIIHFCKDSVGKKVVVTVPSSLTKQLPSLAMQTFSFPLVLLTFRIFLGSHTIKGWMKSRNLCMIQLMQDSFLKVKIYTYLYNFTAWYRKMYVYIFRTRNRKIWFIRSSHLNWLLWISKILQTPWPWFCLPIHCLESHENLSFSSTFNLICWFFEYGHRLIIRFPWLYLVACWRKEKSQEFLPNNNRNNLHMIAFFCMSWLAYFFFWRG